MEKKVTTVNLDKEVIEHAKRFKVNLSECLSRLYRKEYLSIEGKRQELQRHEEAIDTIREEIAKLEERSAQLRITLTSEERRFVSTVMPKLRKGFEMSAMARLFNNDFDRDFTQDEFESMVRLYEEQMQKRVAYAMDRKKKKK